MKAGHEMVIHHNAEEREAQYRYMVECQCGVLKYADTLTEAEQVVRNHQKEAGKSK